MGIYNVGLKSLKIGDFDPATGAISNLVAVEVYKNTLKITEEKPTKTKHFQAGVNSPRKIAIQGGSEMAAFSIMNTAAASLAVALGGTVTTVNTRQRWAKPKGTPKERIKALVAESLDGAIYTIPRGSWTGVKNFDTDEGALYLMEIEVEVTDTGLDLIADVTWDDPAEEED